MEIETKKVKSDDMENSKSFFDQINNKETITIFIQPISCFMGPARPSTILINKQNEVFIARCERDIVVEEKKWTLFGEKTMRTKKTEFDDGIHLDNLLLNKLKSIELKVPPLAHKTTTYTIFKFRYGQQCKKIMIDGIIENLSDIVNMK